MYKIITPAGEVHTVEKPNFIRLHSNGCFVLCPQEKAEGVAYGGTPYMFGDGAHVHEYDAGADMDTQQNAINSVIKTILEG